MAMLINFDLLEKIVMAIDKLNEANECLFRKLVFIG
jgi:hypothetical protein